MGVSLLALPKSIYYTTAYYDFVSFHSLRYIISREAFYSL